MQRVTDDRQLGYRKMIAEWLIKAADNTTAQWEQQAVADSK